MKNKFKALHNLIGNTPLFEIEYKYKNQIKKAYFKAEWYNFTGSIKDRMCLSLLENAYKNKQLKIGQPIIEITSGNTGISLSAIGAFLKNPTIAIMPHTVSKERKKLIEGFGGKAIIVNEKEGGQLKREELREQLASKLKAFKPLQHENKYNKLAHYKTTAPEILKQLKKIKKTPTAFVAGLGTSGTLMGCSKFFKEKIKGFKVYGVEPKESPTFKTGKKSGTHKIQGLNDQFVSPIYNKRIVDKLIDIESEAPF